MSGLYCLHALERLVILVEQGEEGAGDMLYEWEEVMEDLHGIYDQPPRATQLCPEIIEVQTGEEVNTGNFEEIYRKREELALLRPI